MHADADAAADYLPMYPPAPTPSIKVVLTGEADATDRFLPFTVIKDPSPDSPVMQVMTDIFFFGREPTSSSNEEIADRIRTSERSPAYQTRIKISVQPMYLPNPSHSLGPWPFLKNAAGLSPQHSYEQRAHPILGTETIPPLSSPPSQQTNSKTQQPNETNKRQSKGPLGDLSSRCMNVRRRKKFSGRFCRW